MLLALGFLASWGAYRGGFPFFMFLLIFLFIYMATKGGRCNRDQRGYGPYQNPPPQGPQQYRPHDARPYQGGSETTGNPYYGGTETVRTDMNAGTPTMRTGMNSGAGTVRVDTIPGTSGEPTKPLQGDSKPEEPRARLENNWE